MDEPVDSRSRHDRSGGDDELAQLVGCFVAGELDAQGRRRLAHLARSDPRAASEYREALGRAAAVGRATRARREDEAVRNHEARQSRRAHEREAHRRGLRTDRNSLARLRTILLPAFFAFLIWQVTRVTAAPPALSLVLEAGEVEVSGEPLSLAAPGAELRRGDWALSRGEVRATVEGSGVELRLGPDSRLLVERVDPPRLRLEAGSLEVLGSCTLTARTGVAEVEDGSASVALRAGLLEVTCRRGSAVVIDARGERRLGPGESAGATVLVSASLAATPPPADG